MRATQRVVLCNAEGAIDPAAPSESGVNPNSPAIGRQDRVELPNSMFSPRPSMA